MILLLILVLFENFANEVKDIDDTKWIIEKGEAKIHPIEYIVYF